MNMRFTRRELLSGAGALSVGAGLSRAARAAARIHVRLLETSDLHMFALDWDYYHARPDETVGFNKIATLIGEARVQAPNTLLFDNGDIIQGNPLGDFVARGDNPLATGVHPMFRAMNLLGYDAATLGNHEFNYGLGFLDRALSGANFPFVCANLDRVGGGAYVPPFHVFEKRVFDEDGVARNLRVGVIGFVPPQIMTWDKSNLEGHLRCGDILAAARRYIPTLRDRCDLLVALSHSGIVVGPASEGEENASFHLAAIPGVDAILTGHSHRVFPGPDYAHRNGIDADRGSLAGVPAVMPGFWGSHLGVIDLVLAEDAGKWTVSNFAAEAQPIYRRDGGRLVSLVASDARVEAAVAPQHDATKEWVAEPIGAFEAPAHSYFVFAGYDPASAIVNQAQAWYARPLLAGTPHEGLPVLSAAAPFKAGYTPDWFIDIAAGGVAIRDIADLYMYPNTLVAVRVTGAMVREWLEHAARIFLRVDAGAGAPRELVDKRAPSYNFDVIAGVTYLIDSTKPSRYDQNGHLVDATARRIVDLRYDGRPIEDSREFIVVTNNYRADGGGKFPGLDGGATVLRAPDTNREAVVRYVASRASTPPPPASPWRFAPTGRKSTVWFDSAIAARNRVSDVSGLIPAGEGAPGFARYQFDLD